MGKFKVYSSQFTVCGKDKATNYEQQAPSSKGFTLKSAFSPHPIQYGAALPANAEGVYPAKSGYIKAQPQRGFTLIYQQVASAFCGWRSSDIYQKARGLADISALLVRLRRTELPAVKRKSGFTLIELLVAIAIVGVLISIGTVSFTSYQARGNDQKRKADLQRIKLALEKYRLDNYYYPPISEAGCQQPNQGCAKSSESGGNWISVLSPNYLKNMPKDPKQAFERRSLFALVIDSLINPVKTALATGGGGGGGGGPPTPAFRTVPPSTPTPTAPPTYLTPTPTPSPPSPPDCSDGIDNDGDSLVDMDDPGCTTLSDDDEIDPVTPPPPRCSDGIDNDEDGRIDYPADLGCEGSEDNDETDAPAATPTPSAGATPTPPASTPTPPGASPTTPPGGQADFNLSFTYRYDVFPNHQSYILWAALENPNDPDIYYKSGATCRQEPPKSDGKYIFNYCVFPKI